MSEDTLTRLINCEDKTQREELGNAIARQIATLVELLKDAHALRSFRQQDQMITCQAALTIDGHICTKDICLPIVPFPGLGIGCLLVKDVFVCQGGDHRRSIQLNLESPTSVDLKTVECWGGWTIYECE